MDQAIEAFALQEPFTPRPSASVFEGSLPVTPAFEMPLGRRDTERERSAYSPDA